MAPDAAIAAVRGARGPGTLEIIAQQDLLDLPTVHPRVEQASMNTAPAQVAYLVGMRPFPALLKSCRDSRAVICFSGEHNGLLNSAYGRP